MVALIELYQAKKWADLDWAWKHEAAPEDCAVLLALMERDVGFTFDENGFSKRKRYRKPSEVPEELRYPAEVLNLGELAAACREEPPNNREIWDVERSSALAELEQLLDMAEVTEGDASLSRREHALNAIERLEAMERITRLALNELGNDEDAEWLVETVAALALEAFCAGLNYRTAIGKQSEKYAVTGYKLHARKNVQQNKTRPETIALLKDMKEQIDSGKSIQKAAECAREKGLGTSIEANKQAWKRHKKKQKEAERQKIRDI